MKIDKVCKQISKQLNLDYDLVYKIVMYLFLFIRNIVDDKKDTSDILLHKLFRLKLKSRFKDNKTANNSPKRK